MEFRIKVWTSEPYSFWADEIQTWELKLIFLLKGKVVHVIDENCFYNMTVDAAIEKKVWSDE